MVLPLVLLLATCSSATVNTPDPEPPPEPASPPRGAAVALVDLIPSRISGAALLDVAQLRQSSRGAPIIASLRRLGARQWEQRLEVGLERDVRSILVYAVAPRQGGARDLAEAFRGSDIGALRGIVIELESSGRAPADLCHEADLAQLQGEPFETPAGAMNLARCGQYILLSCCDTPLPGTVPHGAASEALARLLDRHEGRSPTLAVVVGTDLVDRATCERAVVRLADWQTLTIDLDTMERDLSFHARFRAASETDAPILEECIETGIGELAGFPLLIQLGLGGILAGVQVDRDPQETKDVLIALQLDAQQVDLVMSFLEIMGEVM